MHSFAEKLGELVALTIGIFLPLVCIIINGVSLRRRSTNSLCAMAIIATLLAVMSFVFAGLGARTVHIQIHTLKLLVVSAAVLMLVSSGLAIAGLIKGRRRRYNRGRKRGIVALILNGLYLPFFIYSLAQGIDQGVALRKLVQAKPPETTTPQEEAWHVRLPAPAEWTPLDVNAFGPEARLAFSRSRPEVFAVVHAERLRDGEDSSLTGAMKLIKGRLNAKGTVEVLDEDEEMEREYLGRTMEFRLDGNSTPQHHILWITRNRGLLYSVDVWGAHSDARQVREEARKMISAFLLVEPRQFSSKNLGSTAPSTVPSSNTATPVPEENPRVPTFKEVPFNLPKAATPAPAMPNPQLDPAAK